MVEEVNYYVRGHTASGFVNFISSNLVGVKNVILLQHASNQVISDVLSTMKNEWDKVDHCEVLCSPYRASHIEGLIVRNRSVAILAADIIGKPKHHYKIIDLHQWLPIDVNTKTVAEGLKLQEQAYECFAKGLHIHDDLEQVYIDEMDFKLADQIAIDLLHQILGNVPKQKRNAHVYERLFGTNTIDGVVNEIEHLIIPIENRVFVKGRAGTGKSVLLRRVVEASITYGYDVELYRCSFDPESIDMVLIRDLNYCLFDSTPPHEFFPSREMDQVIDLYEETVTPGTDEKYEELIAQLTKRYKTEMRNGLACLQQLKQFTPKTDQSKEVYSTSMKEISNHIKNKL